MSTAPNGKPTARSRGVRPLAGVRGQSPRDLALDLRRAALQEKGLAQYVRRPPNVSARHQERRQSCQPRESVDLGNLRVPQVTESRRPSVEAWRP